MDEIFVLALLLALLPAIILLLIGVILMIIPTILGNKKKRTCTEQVTAKCARIEYAADNESSLSHPVWEVEINGQKVEYCHKNVYLAGVAITEGEVRTIYVNPHDNDDFYDPKDKSGAKICYIIGGFMIFLAITMIMSGFIQK